MFSAVIGGSIAAIGAATQSQHWRVGCGSNGDPDEKIFGTGESFTRVDKRGQRVVFFVDDPNGAESGEMYKPIPFFLSSQGNGMFVHTCALATFDFGETALMNGLYASGRTGWYEHNLFPPLYNRAAAEITREITGEYIIWARRT